MESLVRFPESGSYEGYNQSVLIKYLDSTGREGTITSNISRVKGVAWNLYSYWTYVSSTMKKQYQGEQLASFINQEVKHKIKLEDNEENDLFTIEKSKSRGLGQGRSVIRQRGQLVATKSRPNGNAATIKRSEKRICSTEITGKIGLCSNY